MQRVFVLIRAEERKLKDVAASLNSLPEVKNTDRVTGPFDLIVTIEAPDNIDAIGRLVIEQIENIPGIIDTTTCLVANGSGQ